MSDMYNQASAVASRNHWYIVVPWGPNRWAIAEATNPTHPIGTRIYTQKTAALHRQRQLNKAVRQMHAIMAAHRGALIF